jgi:hypothetical protein
MATLPLGEICIRLFLQLEKVQTVFKAKVGGTERSSQVPE